jgi:hypothetical protein
MRAQGDPGQKLGRHEVVQQTALGVGWLGHTEDVLAKPFQQHGIVAEAWRDIVVYLGMSRSCGGSLATEKPAHVSSTPTGAARVCAQ